VHRNVVLTTNFLQAENEQMKLMMRNLLKMVLVGVHVNLILGRIANMSLGVSEGDT
jgi:hypothetical protein